MYLFDLEKPRDHVSQIYQIIRDMCYESNEISIHELENKVIF